MSEQDNFIYEWLYNEDEQTYQCEGQVFYMVVFFDEDTDCWMSVLLDTDPVDDRWSDSQEEMILQKAYNDIDNAMDWCEARDIQEAEFDSATFSK